MAGNTCLCRRRRAMYVGFSLGLLSFAILSLAVWVFDGPVKELTSNSSIVVSTLGVVITSSSLFPLRTAKKTAFNRQRPPRPSRAVACASRLLPDGVRDQYQEEWAAWMLDMREDGTHRVRRWAELLTIVLVAAPRLAISLRTAAHRAVER